MGDGHIWPPGLTGDEKAGIPDGASATDPMVLSSDTKLQQGRINVPLAFYQTASDTAVQLDSASDWIASRFMAKTDGQISSLSDYITALVTSGDQTFEVYSDGTGLEPNGALNGSTTNVLPVMTANDAPAPWVVAAVGSTGEAVNLVGSLYNLFTPGTLVRIGNQKTVTNGGPAVDKGAGKVGIPCVGHGAATGQRVIFNNTTNYTSTYTVDATSSADEIVITSAYVAENFGATTSATFGPSANAPIYVTLDAGLGNTITINKLHLNGTNTCFTESFTYAGSNVASPTVYTDADWTTPADATWSAQTAPADGGVKVYSFTNSTGYRWLRLKVTGSTDNTTNYNFRLYDIHGFAAQSESAPGTSQQVLGTLNSGEVADTWVRLAIDAANRFQCERGKWYWLVGKGAAGADFSVSTRRANTLPGSSIPDGAKSSCTTDGGTTWTQCLQNGLPAQWNVIINSQANHCPQLAFGRHSGDQIFIPGTGLLSIPEIGLLLDCSGKTVDVGHYIYGYSNSGTLAVEASTTGYELTDGIPVKIGAAGYRLLGYIIPQTVQPTFQAPVDVLDTRYVIYDGMDEALGKLCPYYSDTSENLLPLVWKKWMDNDDFKIRCAAMGDSDIDVAAYVVVASANAEVGFFLDTQHPDMNRMGGRNTVGAGGVRLRKSLLPGAHVIYPARRSFTGAATLGQSYYPTAAVIGRIKVRI